MLSIESTDGTFSQQLKRMDDALQEEKRRSEILLREATRAKNHAAKMREEKTKLDETVKSVETEAMRLKEDMAKMEGGALIMKNASRTLRGRRT